MGLFAATCAKAGVEGEAVPMKILIDDTSAKATMATAIPGKIIYINGELWQQYDSASIVVTGATVWKKCHAFRV